MRELNIPESWAETKLEYLVEILDCLRKPITAKDRNEGPYPYYGANGIQGYHDDFIFDDRLLLLAEDGGHFGSKTRDIAYIVEGKYWVNNHAHVLKNIEGVSLDFLFQYLRRFNVKPWVTGATVPKLNQAKTKELPVALPPYKEQVRIANKIESCFSKIEEIEQNLNKVEILLEKYRESLLAKAFRGELTPQVPIDEPASVLLAKIRQERAQNQKGKKKEQEFSPILDDEKPFDIPESWEWVRLEEICSTIADIDHKMPKATESGVIFLSAKDLNNDGTLDFSSPKYISRVDFEKLSRKIKPERNDIIYSRIGARLGKSRVVEVDTEFLVSYSCCTIRPIHSIVDVYFLNAFLDSGFVLEQALRDVKGIGVPDLGMAKIKNFAIPLPPKNVQSQLVKLLKDINSKIRLNIDSNSQKKTLLNRLTESILNKAFEGRLVEQVHSEGTGHELLQKILEQKDQELLVKDSTKKKVAKKVSKKNKTKK